MTHAEMLAVAAVFADDHAVTCRREKFIPVPRVIRHDWAGLTDFWNAWDDALLADRGPSGEPVRETLRCRAWLLWAFLAEPAEWGRTEAMEPADAKAAVITLSEGQPMQRVDLLRALWTISKAERP